MFVSSRPHAWLGDVLPEPVLYSLRLSRGHGEGRCYVARPLPKVMAVEN